ncbi:MAG: potassium transporter TrkG, partial [Nitrosarchaeum sp.]
NLGFVLQFAGVLLIVPAILSTILGESVTATGIYLTTVLLLVIGFFLNSYGEKANLNLHQASILVVTSLFMLSILGTIPYLYVIPHEGSSIDVFANAFFSSAAGFTTGGISLFDEPENLPQSFTFYRSFTQLVGGMSFIYLIITAFYPESKLQSMRGFISGRTLHMRELFATITIIFILYISIIAVLLYLFGERNIIDNVSLAMSTVATGGFVPTSTIMDNLIWQEKLVLIGGMILGALPFTFHYSFFKKRFLPPKLGKEILIYFAILSAAIILFIGLSGLDPLTSIFYSVSASTTAGLQSDNISNFNESAHIILIILMFIGGCGFSTAGGIKVFRLMHLKDIKKLINKKLRSELTPQF